FATGPEPKIFWRRSFHEIVALDVKLATERNLACSGIWIFGVVDCIEFFDFSLGIIRQHDLDRAQYGEPACGGAVEFVTYRVLQHSHVSHARIFRDANVVGELAQGAGGYAVPTQSGDSKHPRVIPAG